MIYLIRHPQSEANVLQISGSLDGKLTKRGEWQSKKTANRLANLPIDNILTSPALRCTYLAEAINKFHDVPVKKLFDLRERDYGKLAGKPGIKIFELGIEGRPEDGESVLDVFERAGKVHKIVSQNGRTLVISHGLFLKMFAAQALGMDMQYALETLKFSNCGISGIDQNRIDFLNDRSHLGLPVNRIHIFGSWAAGKTTLANRLGAMFGIPAYHLDEMKYKNNLTEERGITERMGLLDEITSKSHWITEGTWTSFASSAFNKADFLIYCDVPKQTALENAERRQKSRGYLPGASLEKLLFEINKYYDDAQEVSKRTHDFLYETHFMKSAKSSSIVLEKLEFPEDLRECTRQF